VTARVLVVEDDPTIASVFAAYLRRAGYVVEVVADGVEANDRWARWHPDVVVLDLMLPRMSGLEILRRRREADDVASVLIVSARDHEDDRVLGLETGADDYLVKPVSPRELVVRVHGLVRRAERLAGSSIAVRFIHLGPVVIDASSREVTVHGRAVSLTLREFDLLAYLARHPGETFTKAELITRVWGWEFGDSSTVTVHIRRLREKIERDPSDPEIILTVPRVGYRAADLPGAADATVAATVDPATALGEAGLR
jgi:DNA-binding response OmpR family regulator